MKRFLFISILLTGIAYGQQSTDTLCFPTETVRTLLIDAQQGKLLKRQVAILDDRIGILQEIVKNLEAKDSATVENYETQLTAMREQRALFEDQINRYEKLLRREKRKRFWTGAGGVVSTGIMAFLIFKK